MTVVAGTLQYTPIGNVTAPREPKAIWVSHSYVVSGSGGATSLHVHTLSTGPKPSLDAFSLEFVNYRSHDATTKASIYIAGIDPLLGGASTTIQLGTATDSYNGVSVPNGPVGHAELRHMHPFRARQQIANAPLIYVEFITDNVLYDYESYCWGFVWDGDVYLAGGPIRPQGW